MSGSPNEKVEPQSGFWTVTNGIRAKHRQCVCEEAERKLSLKGGGHKVVSIKTQGPIGEDSRVPHKGTSVKDAGPVDCEILHLYKGVESPVDCEILHLYKGVEISP